MKLIVINNRKKTVIQCDGVIICDNTGSHIAAAIHEASNVIFCAPTETKEFTEILLRLGEVPNSRYIFVDEDEIRNDSGKTIIVEDHTNGNSAY